MRLVEFEQPQAVETRDWAGPRARHPSCSRVHVASELVEHAGGEEGLPSDAAVREVGAYPQAEAAEDALDVIYVYRSVREEERAVDAARPQR